MLIRIVSHKGVEHITQARCFIIYIPGENHLTCGIFYHTLRASDCGYTLVYILANSGNWSGKMFFIVLAIVHFRTVHGMYMYLSAFMPWAHGGSYMSKKWNACSQRPRVFFHGMRKR